MEGEIVFRRPGRTRDQYVEGFLAMGVEWFIAHDKNSGQQSKPLGTKEEAITWLFV